MAANPNALSQKSGKTGCQTLVRQTLESIEAKEADAAPLAADHYVVEKGNDLPELLSNSEDELATILRNDSTAADIHEFVSNRNVDAVCGFARSRN